MNNKGKSRFRMRQILKPHSENKVPTLFLGPSRQQRKLFMGAGANEAEEERKVIPENQITRSVLISSNIFKNSRAICK